MVLQSIRQNMEYRVDCTRQFLLRPRERCRRDKRGKTKGKVAWRLSLSYFQSWLDCRVVSFYTESIQTTTSVCYKPCPSQPVVDPFFSSRLLPTHLGLNRCHIPLVRFRGPCVSCGTGACLAEWMDASQACWLCSKGWVRRWLQLRW